MERVPAGIALPQRLTLAQMAALKVPYRQIQFMDIGHGTVINYELSRFIRRVGRDKIRRNGVDYYRPLRALCGCNLDGDCICYFGVIFEEMTDCYWADETEYVLLEDWCEHGRL